MPSAACKVTAPARTSAPRDRAATCARRRWRAAWRPARSHKPACGGRTARSACSRTNCARAASRTTAARRPGRRRRRSTARCCRLSPASSRQPARRDKFAEHQRGNHMRAEAQPRRRLGRRARRDLPRHPQDRGIDHAGECQMKRQPVLRHADAPGAGEPGRHHPPADRAEQPRRRAKMPIAAHAAPVESRRARGKTETAAGMPRRPAAPAAGASIPTSRSS